MHALQSLSIDQNSSHRQNHGTGSVRKYPKRKRGETYFDNVKNFVTESQQLFDIFDHDEARRTELEIKRKLKMTEKEYWFYEDQKSPRAAKCLNIKEKLTNSNIRFVKRISNPVSKSSTDVPSTSAETMPSSASESESEMSSIASVDTINFEPFSKSARLCQNRESYRNLAQCCDRFIISDRVKATLATSVLMDHGLVNSTNHTLAIDRNKLRRERKKFRLEHQEKEDQHFQYVDWIYSIHRWQKECNLNDIQK